MKFAITNYSGGKDSHIAIYKAKADGYNIPFVFTANGGKFHYKLFNNFTNIELIKKHCNLMNIEFVEIKFNSYKKFLDDKGFSLFCIGIKEILSRLNSDNITFFSSMDYEIGKDDKLFIEKVKKFLKKLNVGFYSVVNGKSTIDVLKLSLNFGIKSLIVGIEKKIDFKWLGRVIDYSFVDYIIKERMEGNWIDANNFQTLVIESPIMKKKIKITDFEIKELTNSFMLKVNDFDVY